MESHLLLQSFHPLGELCPLLVAEWWRCVRHIRPRLFACISQLLCNALAPLVQLCHCAVERLYIAAQLRHLIPGLCTAEGRNPLADVIRCYQLASKTCPLCSRAQTRRSQYIPWGKLQVVFSFTVEHRSLVNFGCCVRHGLSDIGMHSNVMSITRPLVLNTIPEA